jgi:Transposase zinc-binding domain
MGTVTLQGIFYDAYPRYEQTHPLPSHVRRAVHAIMQCRTAALGGHVPGYPDGHVARIWYNSCRHRSCPQCAYLQTEGWLALQQARLLACAHSHMIFMLPHALKPLWLANVPVMSTCSFRRCGRRCATCSPLRSILGRSQG